MKENGKPINEKVCLTNSRSDTLQNIVDGAA